MTLAHAPVHCLKKQACTGFKTLTDAIPNTSQTELKFARPSIIVAILFTWSLLLTLEPIGGAALCVIPVFCNKYQVVCVQVHKNTG